MALASSGRALRHLRQLLGEGMRHLALAREGVAALLDALAGQSEGPASPRLNLAIGVHVSVDRVT